MRYFIPLLLFIVCFTSCKEKTTPVETIEVAETAVTTTKYYLIRHAEKDRSDPENRNPSLTEEGNARANRWAEHFKAIPFDMIYSTDYNRTQETATPTATQKGLEIQSYDPRTLFDVDFQEATKGKTVLVVGHSNTTPMFANAILQEERYEHIDDSDNSNLFIVTIKGDEKTSERLRVE